MRYARPPCVRWLIVAILTTAISWTLPASAKLVEELTAEVVAVSDGDCITVLREGRQVEIRLEGIDAPERGQAYFEVARTGLEHAVLGKTVDVKIVGRDFEQRLTGRVFLGDIDINLELVKAGLAWHFRQVSDEEALREAEKAARRAKRGLWQQRPRPLPPWKYRLARQVPEEEEREIEEPGYLRRPGSGGGPR